MLHMDTMYNICCFNALKLNGKDTPLLNFTANIIEVLGFSWIHILSLNWLLLSLNCFSTLLNCTTAPLNQTAAGIATSLNYITTPLCTTGGTVYWIQLELHFVSKFNFSRCCKDYVLVITWPWVPAALGHYVTTVPVFGICAQGAM